MLMEGLHVIPWKPMPQAMPYPSDFSVSTNCCVQLPRPLREMPAHWEYDSVVCPVFYYARLLPSPRKVETVNRMCPWSQAQYPSPGKNRLQTTNLEHELEAALSFFVS